MSVILPTMISQTAFHLLQYTRASFLVVVDLMYYRNLFFEVFLLHGLMTPSYAPYVTMLDCYSGFTATAALT